jgi:hypothetical protein
MKNQKLLQFKQQVESISYDDILANRFQDLTWHRHGDDFGMPTLSCTFTMDIKVWKQYRDAGQLGSIYNCDLSNFLSRKGILQEYCVPIVSDKKPARGGRKTISVEFRLKGHPSRGQ